MLKFNNQFRRSRAQNVSRPEQLISTVWANLDLSFQGLTALARLREAFRRRRCFVPLYSCYEWKKQRRASSPYPIPFKGDG